MQSAVQVAGSNRFLSRSCALLAFLMLFAGAVASAEPAPARSSSPQAPPVAVSGWRHELRDSDVHMFYCEQAGCGVGSKVSYRLYAPGGSMTLEQFRAGQEQVVRALEQRSPEQKISILGVDGDSGAAVPRMFKARRLRTGPNGQSEYQVSASLFGSRASASLISTSPNEKASNDNFAQFALAVMLVLAPR